MTAGNRGVDDLERVAAVHAQLATHGAHRVQARHAGAVGVIAGAAVAPGVIEQFVVRLDLRTG